MSYITDDEILQGIISLTAQFRYRVCWRGAHSLLRGREIEPTSVMQLSCDQGFSVSTLLLLPDGTVVNIDFADDPKTRELVSVTDWRVSTHSDRRIELGRRILASDTTDFDRRVLQEFDEHWRDSDRPLPS